MIPAPQTGLRRRPFNDNAFAIGLFSFNCSGGLFRGKRQVWNATWENTLEAARLSDEAGLEFLLPLDRWRGQRGYPAESEFDGGSFESLIWASGILAHTKRITVFSTMNVRFVNPVFASKQIVTAHHIGGGRLGLNIVSGSEVRDAQMMGVEFDDHDARYDYTEEWLGVIKRAWTEAAPFDHTGRYFQLKQVLLKPKPLESNFPLLISAGASKRGRSFALRNADALFTAISNFETIGDELRTARGAVDDGARIPAFASGHLITRRTKKEADEYHHYLVHELGDWAGVDEVAEHRMRNRTVAYRSLQQLKEAAITGNGTFAIRGSYDEVVDQFVRLNQVGLDGMALALVDYIGEFPMLRDEILPRMERAGLRMPARGA